MSKILFSFLSCIILILNSCTTTTQEEEEGTNDGIAGLWYSTDHKSSKIRCLVAIYQYQQMYYGRILVTYDGKGHTVDTILTQKDRAPGVVGNPPYCGLDFIYNVHATGGYNDGSPTYKGKIIDPEKGKEYSAQLWRDGNDLIVRGELWIFGKNIRWFRAPKEALPKGFSAKEIQNFVPKVPELN